MAYRTLAWVMALICGLAIPAGAGTLGSGFFDEPIFQPGAYEKLVTLRAKTPGVVGRNIAVNTAVQNSGIPASTPAHSIVTVDNALLVSVNGNELVDHGVGNRVDYNKSTVASCANSFNHSIGVANVNVASGNLNVQTTYYSGPDLSSIGLPANGGSTNLTAIRK